MKPLETGIRITFLGTGTSTGVPVVACDCRVCKSPDIRDKRLRASLLIECCGKKIVIDCGPDFRYQMIRQEVDDLDAILITHEHRDHIAGLDDVRGFNYVLNKSMDVYASEQVISSIYREFPYFLTEKRFFGAPQLNFHPLDGSLFDVNGLQFTPIRVMHNKLEIYAYRLADFTYITDASAISMEEIDKIRGSKVIVINALRNSKHVSHFCLQEAVELLAELNPDKAFITHMSHFIGLHEELSEKLPSYVEPAYDGLVYAW